MTKDQHYGVYESVNDEKHPTELMDDHGNFFNLREFKLGPDVYKIEMSSKGNIKGKNNENSFGKFITVKAGGSDQIQPYEDSFSEKPVMDSKGIYISARLASGPVQNIYILDYEANTQMVKVLFFNLNHHKVWLKKSNANQMINRKNLP